jgi:hypothetical protein
VFNLSTTSQSVPSKEALVELSAAIMQAAGVRVVHISGTDDQSVMTTLYLPKSYLLDVYTVLYKPLEVCIYL